MESEAGSKETILRLSVKVGDLVIQLGWEADGVGIITKYTIERLTDDTVTVQWPNGTTDMYRSQLKVVSESR